MLAGINQGAYLGNSEEGTLGTWPFTQADIFWDSQKQLHCLIALNKYPQENMCFYMLAEYKPFGVGNLDAFFSTAGNAR